VTTERTVRLVQVLPGLGRYGRKWALTILELLAVPSIAVVSSRTSKLLPGKTDRPSDCAMVASE